VTGKLQTIVLPNGTSAVYSLDIAPETIKADSTGTMNSTAAPNIDSVSLSFSKADIPPETKGDAVVTSTQWVLSGSVKGYGIDLNGLGVAFSGTTETSSMTTQKDWTLKISASPYFGASMVMKEKIDLSGAGPNQEGTLDFYFLSGGQPLGTAEFSVSATDPEVWPVIPADSVHLGKMTTEEIKAWWQQTYAGVLQKLKDAAGNLPDSILTIVQGFLVLLK
jgi:hypothetical protein